MVSNHVSLFICLPFLHSCLDMRNNKFSFIFAFAEDAGIKTMVSAIVPTKHRLSAPEPKTRSDFLECKPQPDLWF